MELKRCVFDFIWNNNKQWKIIIIIYFNIKYLIHVNVLILNKNNNILTIIYFMNYIFYTLDINS